MKKKILLILTLVIIAAVGVGLFFLLRQGGSPGPYDFLAKCLSGKGVKMYGTWWCPHCQNQKKTFGSSWKYINYVECAIGQYGQTRECKDAGIKGYPTWILPDGTRFEGEQSIESIGKSVGCATSPVGQVTQK